MATLGLILLVLLAIKGCFAEDRNITHSRFNEPNQFYWHRNDKDKK